LFGTNKYGDQNFGLQGAVGDESKGLFPYGYALRCVARSIEIVFLFLSQRNATRSHNGNKPTFASVSMKRRNSSLGCLLSTVTFVNRQQWNHGEVSIVRNSFTESSGRRCHRVTGRRIHGTSEKSRLRLAYWKCALCPNIERRRFPATILLKDPRKGAEGSS